MKTWSYSSLVGLLGLLLTVDSQALDWGCKTPVSSLTAIGTRLIQNFNNTNTSFPNVVQLGSSASIELSSSAKETMATAGTFEGFVRPLRDADYSYIVLPFFVFELSRDNDVIYLCAHGDENPSLSHVTFYMLKGYRLEPLNMTSLWTDLFHAPKMVQGSVMMDAVKISPPAAINPLPILDSIPIIAQLKNIPVSIFQALNRAFAQFVTLPIGGASIERLVLTNDYLALESDVDLNHPEHARTVFHFDLNSDTNK